MFAAASNQRPFVMDNPIESKGIPPLGVAHLLTTSYCKYLNIFL